MLTYEHFCEYMAMKQDKALKKNPELAMSQGAAVDVMLEQAKRNARIEAITAYKEALLREVECFDECTVDNPLAETHCVVREEYIYDVANKMLEELK